MNKLKKVFLRWEWALLLLIALEIAVFGAMNSKFLNLTRLFGSLNQFIPVAIIALFIGNQRLRRPRIRAVNPSVARSTIGARTTPSSVSARPGVTLVTGLCS